MAPKEKRVSEDDNVLRFDFRDELKKQRGKQLRKEWILGLGAFSFVFAGGMLALNWPTLGSTSLTSSELTPKFSLVAETSSPRFELCGMTRRTCVVDGDTFWLEGEKIRIADIDTPEISEPKCDAEYQRSEEHTSELQSLMRLS